MKQHCVIAILLLLLGVSVIAAPPSGQRSPVRMVTALDYEAFIDANNIFMFITNQGNYGRDLSGVYGHDYGTFFPYNGQEFIADGSLVASPLYAAGIWAGATDSATGERLVTVSIYSSEYIPGPIVTDTPLTVLVDNDSMRVYKLYKDSLEGNPNQDYLEWPVNHGAPVDSLGNPKMIGDQMTWAVYNDWHTIGTYDNESGSTPPLGLEIRQSTFAFDREGPLGNCVFFKFQIFNKGDKVLRDCYFSLWADPDLGTSSDDLVGVDTLTGLGYTYNASATDGEYQNILPYQAPPAIGFDFFQGPLVFTGSLADTAKAWDSLWPGYRALPMASFNKYINGTDPNSAEETYNYMLGLQSDGNPLSNGTTFQVPGDPVGQTGDLDVAPADRRMMQSTGPITFRPGDSVEIVAGMVVGWYQDQLSSISFMRYYDIFAQSAYEEDFIIPEPPAPPIVSVAALNGEISLAWTDTSEADPGDFPFEGYTVYQGESANGPWKQIANYAVLGVDIIDLALDPISGQLEQRVVKNASDKKIQRYIGIDRDYINGGDLDNGTTYFFQVEAYSYDGTKTPKMLQSITLATSTPQAPPADVDLPTNYGDSLPVAHVGPSDGSVLAHVIDPNLLTGHDYRVSFFDTDSGTAWRLTDLTLNTILVDSQFNQTYDEDYEIVDGMIVKVSGPPPGMKTISPGDFLSCDPDDPSLGWCFESGARPFTWAGGASDLHFENFEGAAGWHSPSSYFGGAPQPVTAPEIVNIQLRLATTDSAGVFDPNDPNASYAYRYGRGFASAPALPEFAPYIVNATSGYSYQDFTKSVPLSAWNMETDPPTRLAVGFLENNAAGGMVNGRYMPPLNSDISNVDGAGPREWLFIYKAPYSETPDPNFQVEAIGSPMPIMYFMTWARRNLNPWAAQVMNLYANHVNSPADVFSFTATAPTTPTSSQAEANLNKIVTVPNPFYLYSNYDPAVGNYQLQFQHLPRECKITIYSLSGELVRTIDKNDETDRATWDLLTSNSLPVASGIYLWVVDAPGVGQKIGKMAIFTEVEVIDRY
ncbi:MAG: hypothetical protein IPH75_00120 [bacterium]|nr:hypothetical protein [bacterium]